MEKRTLLPNGQELPALVNSKSEIEMDFFSKERDQSATITIEKNKRSAVLFCKTFGVADMKFVFFFSLSVF